MPFQLPGQCFRDMGCGGQQTWGRILSLPGRCVLWANYLYLIQGDDQVRQYKQSPGTVPKGVPPK